MKRMIVVLMAAAVLIVLGAAVSMKAGKPASGTVFIRDISSRAGGYEIVLDDVEFLSGEAAIQAVMEDKKCARKDVAECVPSMNNDFYIRNLSTSTQSYRLDPKARILAFQSPGSPVLIEVSPDELTREFRDPAYSIRSYTFKYDFDGRTIRSMEEQYVP